MNKLYKGDCLEIMKNIPDGSIDMICIDPPYKMQNGQKGNTPLGNRLQKRRNELIEKNMISFGTKEIQQIAKEFKRIQKKTNIFIFASKDQIRDWYNAYENINPYILFWGKTNPAPTFKNSLLPNCEYILWFKDKGVTMNTTYQNASRYDITPINTKDKKKYNHPTCKPVEILKRYISIATNEKETVLDCFMGTGSTGVACKELNRNFIGIEIDEKYYEIAKERLGQ